MVEWCRFGAVVCPLKNMDPIPVLLMSEMLSAGGSERQLVETAKSLDRRRFSAHVATLKGGFRQQELAKAGIPVVNLALDSFASFTALKAGLRLRNYIKTHNIQLFHSFDYSSGCFGVPVARLAATPVVLSSTRAHRSLYPPFYQRLLRLTDPLVHGMIVNCEAMRNHLIQDESISPSRIHLCPNGIDLSNFNPQNRIRPAFFPTVLQEASLIIGVICVLRQEKGLSTLLEAFANVSEQHPGLRLAIVGSGTLLPELQQKASSLQISAKCHFEPSTRNVPAWLGGIDIFVLPSLSEAFSNSLMEAMACGCAVVASNTGGNPELVHHNDTGLLFEPGNSKSLSHCLNQLISQPETRQRFAIRAANYVATNLAVQTAAARMGQIYTSLLSSQT